MATDPKQDKQQTEAEGWRPETGDVLTGAVTEVAKGWSDYTDSFYPIVTIKEDVTGKLLNVHCFHEILKQRMLDARPEVGDKLEIECLGEKRTKDDKRSYVGYRVTIPGETGARVWEDLTAQGGRAGRSARPAQGKQETLEDDIPF